MTELQTDALPSSLPEITPDDFLPPIGPWLTLGGLVGVGIMGAGVAIASIFTFNTVIKAPAVIRPSGEVSITQSPVQGTVQAIWVSENEQVDVGQIIATLDDSQLQTQKRQMEGAIAETEQHIQQLDIQLQQLAWQTSAEQDRVERTVVAAEAELDLAQRQYSDRQQTTVAQVQMAQAELDLAREQLARYSQLAESGAIAQIQIREREATVATAQARLEEVQTTLNPSTAEVSIAQENIIQAQASGEATLAQLTQQQTTLSRQKIELGQELDHQRQELAQVNQNLQQLVIKAPSAGTLQELSLRNAEQVVQPGEAIAHIVPDESRLMVKSFVPSQAIDQVALGQTVQLRVNACPYPDYGTVDATVVAIAPDVFSGSDAKLSNLTPHTTYEVTIQPNEETLTTGTHVCSLQIGMDGRADIIARRDTILKFLLRKTRLASDF